MKKIDYQKIISEHPWIIQKNKNAILSPDADGFLCGLFMSDRFGWKIAGFYDGKVLKIKRGISASDCVFLDMEILRSNIRSIGHHMNMHNFNAVPDEYDQKMANCINPNQIRKFDRSHNFSGKYPLGSIHLLMAIADITNPKLSKVRKEGFGAVFFADGVWKILFKYTENIMNWFDYLDLKEQSSWWKELQELSVIDLIKEINILLKKLQNIHPQQKRWYGHIDINYLEENTLLNDYLVLLSNLTGWEYKSRNWIIKNFETKTFTKKIMTSSNDQTYREIWSEKPISLAMTDRNTIQYTLERPDNLD